MVRECEVSRGWRKLSGDSRETSQQGVHCYTPFIYAIVTVQRILDIHTLNLFIINN